eukprot:jgi/Tetstr1/429697/TSEL_019592.t1
MRDNLRQFWACYATAPSTKHSGHLCALGRPDTRVPEFYTCPSCPAPAVPAAHLPEWRRPLTGANGLGDLRLRSSTTDTYRTSMHDYCFFCTAQGATLLPATLGLMHSGPPRDATSRLLPVVGFRQAPAHVRHRPTPGVMPPPAKAAAALTCDYNVSGSGAVSYTELIAVRVIFHAELGCRYIRLRVVDVDRD